MSGWIVVGRLADLPRPGGRRVVLGGIRIAVFRTGDDAVFALLDRCPHRAGPLSEGLVHGHCVTCPLHGWVIDLETGSARESGGQAVPAVPVRVREGWIELDRATLLALSAPVAA